MTKRGKNREAREDELQAYVDEIPSSARNYPSTLTVMLLQDILAELRILNAPKAKRLKASKGSKKGLALQGRKG